MVVVAEAVVKQRRETFSVPGDQKPDHGPDLVKGRGGLAWSHFRAGGAEGEAKS